MSVRYNLRNRPGGSAVPPGPGTGESPPGAINTDLAPPGSPLTRSTDSESDTGGRSPGSERRPGVTYSQAAGSRSPSPLQRMGREAATAAISSSDPPGAGQSGTLAANLKNRVTVEDASDEDDAGPWIPVVRQRRSTGSQPLNTEPITPRKRPALSVAQQEVVRTAEAAMSERDRERIGRRMKRVRNTLERDTSVSSRGEGPSRDKGKTVDARNWGSVGIPAEELDPAAQRRELEMYSVDNTLSRDNTLDGYSKREQQEMLRFWQANKAHSTKAPASEGPPVENEGTGAPEEHVSERPSPVDSALPAPLAQEFAALRREMDLIRSSVRRSGTAKRAPSKGKDKLAQALQPSANQARDPETSSRKRKSIYPVSQIEPGSYLGRAFADLTGIGASEDDSPESSSSSSSSEDASATTSSSSDSGRGSPSDSSSGPGDHKNKKKCKRRRSKKPVLKPEKPEPYDGRPDAQAFHKFMRQMTEYLMGYSTRKSMYASTV
ncbi:hypothetical protein C8Q79DRAFT_881662, partial [Trametes meyenii]